MTVPSYQRILLTRLRFIGDIVLTTPIIKAVREAQPQAHISFLGDREGVTLLEGNPNLNDIIPYDYARSSAAEQLRMARLLRSKKFDLVIDMFNNPRSALLTLATGARVRIGLTKKGRGFCYTIQVTDDGKPKSPIAFHNQFLAAAGIAAATSGTEIFLTPEEREGILSLLPDGNGPLIGIHPGATWPAKRWLPEGFAWLGDRLQDDGARVVLTAGRNDASVVRDVLESSAKIPHVLPVLPLRQLAAAIAACDVYVTNDAGPMHIAAALGVPTIGIFGPGEENIWFPYDPALGHRALRHDVECHPCHKDFCPLEGDNYMRCMNLLDRAEVLAAVRRSLSYQKTSASDFR